MVLLDEASGRYWQINGTAALVLRALLDGATEHEAAQRLVERYPAVAVSRAADDVASVVVSLSDARLVVRA
jgi:hypothetical protein